MGEVYCGISDLHLANHLTYALFGAAVNAFSQQAASTRLQNRFKPRARAWDTNAGGKFGGSPHPAFPPKGKWTFCSWELPGRRKLRRASPSETSFPSSASLACGHGRRRGWLVFCPLAGPCSALGWKGCWVQFAASGTRYRSMLRVGLFLTENVFLVIFEIEESEMEVDMSCFNLFFSALLAGPVCVWWIQMTFSWPSLCDLQMQNK